MSHTYILTNLSRSKKCLTRKNFDCKRSSENKVDQNSEDDDSMGLSFFHYNSTIDL